MADKTLSFIKTWGPTCVYVLTFVFGCGVLYAKLQEHDRRISVTERDHDTIMRVDANLQLTMRQLKIEPITGKVGQ